eukprot:GEMP01017359.1.p1 GENE.GEMP01017359.1~~GEMP01017359.1.p1  ORF type:complete len:693 (+),score=137.73 GEMP01017359.1:97-2175(+)
MVLFLHKFVAFCGVAGTYELTILHINDHHSHLDAETFAFGTSDLPLENHALKQEVQVTYGGLTRMTRLFHEKSEEIGPDVLRIHAGDAITGTVYFNMLKGEASAMLMKLMCLDVFVLGNHEFDCGDHLLANFITMLTDAQNNSHCPHQEPIDVLAANVVPGPTSPLKGLLKPYVIKMLSKGHQVAIIGIDMARHTMEGSSPDKGTMLTDELNATRATINDIKRAHPSINKIVLVTHVSYTSELALVQQLTDVDVIVGAHSHTLLGNATEFTAFEFHPDPNRPYPTVVTNHEKKMVCIVQAWKHAHLLGALSVTFDDNGDVIKCGGTPLIPYDNSTITTTSGTVISAQKTTADAGDVNTIMDALQGSSAHQLLVPTRPDARAAAALQHYRNQLGAQLDTTIGSATQAFCRCPRPPQEPCKTVSYYGSALANIIAKGYLMDVPAADLCIVSGGTPRVALEKGEITARMVYRVLPYRDNLATITMTGTQVRAVLEDALVLSYPYAAGIRYSVDMSVPFGSRVSNIEVHGRGPEARWTLLDAAQSYNVLTMAYLAKGKDGYRAFGKLPSVTVRMDYTRVFIDYIKKHPSVGALPLEEYSTQRYTEFGECEQGAFPSSLWYSMYAWIPFGLIAIFLWFTSQRWRKVVVASPPVDCDTSTHPLTERTDIGIQANGDHLGLVMRRGSAVRRSQDGHYFV